MDVTPIVKPQATFCNLRCEYCFYRKTNQERKTDPMERNILENLISETQSLNTSRAEYDWLGGEPLLAGLDFFKEVVEVQKHYQKKGQTIINKLQSNGVLIDDEWISFFQRNGFQIGISIDGPARCHDRYRKDDKGQDTHQRVINAIRLLKSADDIRWGTITVVSKANVDVPQEVFEFFLSEKVTKMAFNPVKGVDPQTSLPIEAEPTPQEYATFMKTVFDLWLKNDDPKTNIRQFHSIMQGILGGRYRLCGYAGQCYRFFSVDNQGNTYPCEDDIPTEDICFGNIAKGWNAILASDKFLRYRQLIDDIRRECQACKWWNVCGGSCTRNYNLGFASMKHKNYLCEAEKSLFEHIFQRMQRSLPHLHLFGQEN